MADLSPYPGTGDDTGVGRERESPPGIPRWVKVSGIIGLVVVLLIVIALVTGLHGPGAHGPGGHLAGLPGHTAPASATVAVMDHP